MQKKKIAHDFRYDLHIKISNLTKTRPVGAELCHAGGQTDATELIGAFRNFAKSAYNINNCHQIKDYSCPDQKRAGVHFFQLR